MSEALPLRDAHPADLPRLAALAGPAFGPAWSAEELAKEHASGARLCVAAAPGAPATGFALCRAVGDEAELRLLVVTPEARGRGTGGALLRRMLAELGAAGVRRVHLEVRAGNVAAQRLYVRAGFIRVGGRRRYYPDGEDAELLTCTLDAAGAAA